MRIFAKPRKELNPKNPVTTVSTESAYSYHAKQTTKALLVSLLALSLGGAAFLVFKLGEEEEMLTDSLLPAADKSSLALPDEPELLDISLQQRRSASVSYEAGEARRLNDYETYRQQWGDLAPLRDGGWVGVWTDAARDGSSWGVYGRCANATGEFKDFDFKLNSYTSSYQLLSAVTLLTDGKFVVTWQSNAQAGDEGYGIRAQIFSASCQPVGSEFPVNTVTVAAQESADITGLVGGGFVIVWQSFNQDESGGYGVFFQIFDSEGKPVGPERQANSHTLGNQEFPKVNPLPDGGFRIGWSSDNQNDCPGKCVFARRFDAEGNPDAPEFQINTYTASDQSSLDMATSIGGDFLAVWDSLNQGSPGLSVFGQYFTDTDQREGSEFRLDNDTVSAQWGSATDCLREGGCIVFWKFLITQCMGVCLTLRAYGLN